MTTRNGAVTQILVLLPQAIFQPIYFRLKDANAKWEVDCCGTSTGHYQSRVLVRTVQPRQRITQHQKSSLSAVLSVCFDYESVHSCNNRLAQSLSDSPVILISENNYVSRFHAQPTFTVKINPEQRKTNLLLLLFEQTLKAIKASEGLQFSTPHTLHMLYSDSSSFRIWCMHQINPMHCGKVFLFFAKKEKVDYFFKLVTWIIIYRLVLLSPVPRSVFKHFQHFITLQTLTQQ